MNSKESVAQAILEQQEKCALLHVERGKAWHEMRDASTQHEFLVEAGRAADAKLRELRHLLRELYEREAMELVR